ncbi:MAG: hypothetical protein LC679_10310, partial [Intrasporangiaceae bacterium]|nr:hypothetical protein [Intrasporangiaceae bacterium]
MSFFDKAKQAAAEMAAKADAAMAQAGVSGQGLTGSFGGGQRESDTVLRDYGLIAWREQTGHPVDGDDKERVLAAMQALEASGAVAGMRLSPPPATPPPPPGAAAAGAPPPPPGAAASSGASAPPSPPPPPPPAGPS